MDKEQERKEIWTIPNILSMFRILLAFAFVSFFFIAKSYHLDKITIIIVCCSILVVSGITDLLDGFIARKFNMVSWLGKMLDPFADKITQVVVFICLLSYNAWLFIPFVLLCLREIFMFITGYIYLKKTGKTFSALWYGKLSTFTIYASMVAILLFSELGLMIPLGYIIIIVIDIAVIILSLVLYLIHNFKLLKEIQ